MNCEEHGGQYVDGRCPTEIALDLVREERAYQNDHYGVNHWPDGTGPETRWLLPLSTQPAKVIEAELRRDYEDYEEETGEITWVHLVREEIAESFKEDNPEHLLAEVTQVAALCVSWMEDIQSRCDLWRWGVMDSSSEIVKDQDWHCAADVMATANGFGHGPFQVMVKRPGMPWTSFWG